MSAVTNNLARLDKNK